MSAFDISSGVAANKNEAKRSSKITKARAERIAFTKVPGGCIHGADWRQCEDGASGPFISRSLDRKARKKSASMPQGGKICRTNGKTGRSGRRASKNPLRERAVLWRILTSATSLLCPMATRPLLKLNKDAIAAGGSELENERLPPLRR